MMSQYVQVAALVIMLLSTVLNGVAAIRLTDDLAKVSDLFCIEGPR